jgi:serine/threonine protein kinase
MPQTLSGAEGRDTPSSLTETLPPRLAAPEGQAPAELLQFLAPAQGPDELGRLGPYRILAVLGHGGMGVVYKAEDTQLERLVALKAMLPGLAASSANRQRFLREARAAAKIEHDHIVTIYQVGEDRGVPFLAMPLLQGESLNERLQREPRLPVGEVLRISRETAAGLAAAHERGLIHRDVKPANLWLEANGGRVKLLDFGLARAAAESGHLTATGAILGTPAYMSPEQASGKAVDGRTDLFSLGCVMYRVSTGDLPFKGTDPISTLMAVAMEQPPAPIQLNPEVPPALSGLVMELLAKNPAERPVSAQDVIRRLRDIEQGTMVQGNESVPADVLPAAVESAGQEKDKTLPLAEAVPAGPAEANVGSSEKALRERERALMWTGIVFGAGVFGVLGALIGLLGWGASGEGVVGGLAGLAIGAFIGYLIGQIAVGVYDGYVTAERERRRQMRRR